LRPRSRIADHPMHHVTATLLPASNAMAANYNSLWPERSLFKMPNHPVSVLLRLALIAALAVGGATVASAGNGQSTPTVSEKQTIAGIQKALERLPYYGVFDFLAFGLDRGTVTLVGYAYRGALKTEAEKAVKRVSGVDTVVNKIEILPASRLDDEARWATYYRVYTDEFLTRYVPSEASMAARYQNLDLFLRFPGMQPFGTYPVHIVVKNLRTTLFGVVDNAADKTKVFLRAQGVSGVLNVDDQVMTTPPGAD
jgi:hyperosmotically inducible periplasmic protein